ncbi:MAG: ATP-binding protein [Pseudomonadota bacterium]
MTNTEHPLKVNASSLRQRLADLAGRAQHWLPAVADPEWDSVVAASWRSGPLGGGFRTVVQRPEITLGDLRGIDRQKRALEANTRRFVRGLPANHALLWGARGGGKSSLVHALLNRFAADGLRLVELNKADLVDLSSILARLTGARQRFVLFCDDLSFEGHESSYKSVKSALDGSIFRTAENVLFYATSNRRHLLPESMTDNETARRVEGELHPGEAIEEKISLSDRFGLWLSFYPLSQDEYLDIARHWVAALGARHGDGGLWSADARAEALRFALARGVRSGRAAEQFARAWVGEQLERA